MKAFFLGYSYHGPDALAQAALEASVNERFDPQCALHGGVNCGYAFGSDPTGYELKRMSW